MCVRHLLQILLHFEALKLCSSVELETKMATANTVRRTLCTCSVANDKFLPLQLVVLFRKLSLLANPGLVGSCLKKIVLPV